MTNVQLLLSVGMPTLAVLVGILLNAHQVNNFQSGLQGQINLLSSRIDMLTGKVMELTDRVSRLEALMGK